MSKQITDWTNEVLLPEAYSRLDSILPEFCLFNKGTHWISTNGRKITGEDGEARKVYVYRNNPTRLVDYTRGSIGIIDYIMERDMLQFIEAVKLVANSIGQDLPKGDLDGEAYRKAQQKQDLLEDVASYYFNALWLGTEAGPSSCREYVKQRGYSEEHAAVMRLGYAGTCEQQLQKLLEKYDKEQIAQYIRTDKHLLAIPYRAGGKLQGFLYRTITEDKNKYMASSGLDRKGCLFNLNSKVVGNVILVEGELDALAATVAGVENVVAYGKKQASVEQILDAVGRGARSFTIVPDREQASGRNEVEATISAILKAGVTKIYIATLPDLGGKTDTDRLIREKGLEAFNKAIAEAIPYWKYWLSNLLDEYQQQTAGRDLTDMEQDSLIDDATGLASSVADPIQREQYLNVFQKVASQLGISKSSLEATVERLRIDKEKARQQKLLEEVLRDAGRLTREGKLEEAAKLLQEKGKVAEAEEEKEEFKQLLQPLTREKQKQLLRNRPASLNSGYMVDGEPIELRAGALTIIAAPSGHGKSTFLMNIAVNLLEEGKTVYFFNYEEESSIVQAKILNVFIDRKLATNNRKALLDYLDREDTSVFYNDKARLVEDGMRIFYSDYVDTGKLVVSNVHGYDVEKLHKLVKTATEIGKPSAILVDYIQLINPTEKTRNANRQVEMKMVCNELKDVAVETGLPLVFAAQFNREVKNQLDLQETKLREAGDIEQAANTVVALWNNDREGEATKDQKERINREGMNLERTVYIKILKNRDGRVPTKGECLTYYGETGKIKTNYKPIAEDI